LLLPLHLLISLLLFLVLLESHGFVHLDGAVVGVVVEALWRAL
jgi:hypothetical protein